MANLDGFDASQQEEQMSFDAIPPGEYVVVATASEMKPNKQGTGQYLQFVFEVIDGEYKGRKLWARMNLISKSEMAVKIAKIELGALSRAVGIQKPKDSSELHNKPLRVHVDVELDDRRREGNVIKKYEAVPGTAYVPPAGKQGAAPSPAPSPAPAQSTSGNAAAPSAQPWNAGGGTAPWKS